MSYLYKLLMGQVNCDLLVVFVFHVVKFSAKKSLQTDNVWHIRVLAHEMSKSKLPFVTVHRPKS